MLEGPGQQTMQGPAAKLKRRQPAPGHRIQQRRESFAVRQGFQFVDGHGLAGIAGAAQLNLAFGFELKDALVGQVVQDPRQGRQQR